MVSILNCNNYCIDATKPTDSSIHNPKSFSGFNLLAVISKTVSVNANTQKGRVFSPGAEISFFYERGISSKTL